MRGTPYLFLLVPPFWSWLLPLQDTTQCLFEQARDQFSYILTSSQFLANLGKRKVVELGSDSILCSDDSTQSR